MSSNNEKKYIYLKVWILLRQLFINFFLQISNTKPCQKWFVDKVFYFGKPFEKLLRGCRKLQKVNGILVNINIFFFAYTFYNFYIFIF